MQKSELSMQEMLIVRAITAVLITGLMVLAGNPDRIDSLETLGQLSDYRYIETLFAVFMTITGLDYYYSRKHIYSVDLLALFAASVLYAVRIVLATTDIYFAGLTVVMLLFVVRYVCSKMKTKAAERFFEKNSGRFIIILSVITVFYLGMLLILRLLLFRPVTYDFGIFVQMFHYLKETGIPYTTCERAKLLSHFIVHFSPFFYLLLPFYMVFPSPFTLVIVQLLAVISGVIPLYLMCRRKQMKPVMTVALCVAYLSYPTFRGGLFFDFHENKFLAPLVLWLLFFFDMKKKGKKKYIGIILFTLLILSVKEDAPIYSACIGLYKFLSGKEKETRTAGGAVFLFSVVYFFVVFHFMGKYGDAGSAITSFGRYENLTYGGYQGIGNLVMNMVKDPAYVLKQLMTAEKLEFILWMFLPILFLPFRSRNFASYILLIPLIVLNLLSNYGYQHSIYYQYAYASGALVLYLTYLEAAKIPGRRSVRLAISMMLASVLLSLSCISDRNTSIADYRKDADYYVAVREMLQSIPKDASVAATTSYVPVMAERNEIYRIDDRDDTDYLVLSLRGSHKFDAETWTEQYGQAGYEVYGKIDDWVIVFKK